MSSKITFLQQSKSNKSTFAVEKNPEHATHFEQNGKIRPISQLDKHFVLNDEAETNAMPAMNFGDEEQKQVTPTEGQEVLAMPAMNFSDKKNNQQNNKTAVNDGQVTNKMPTMF